MDRPQGRKGKKTMNVIDIIDLGIAAMPVITVIAFFFGEVAKCTKLNNKWIPVICAGVGGALGVAAMYTMPDFVATDILSAVAVGIVSGLSATGLHQTLKQLSEGGKEVK